MRKISAAAALLLLLAAFAAGAKPALSLPSLSQEVSAALADYSAREIGDLTVSDMEEIAARVAAAQRTAAFVPKSAMMSMMMPGMGQFVNGDKTAGALFAAGHLAVAAGTIAAVWLLLPLDVQPQSLFVADLSQFKPALEGHSPLEYLPAAAAAAGGMLLDGILRSASAHHAARLAAKNIAEGRVSFEPGIGPMGGGFMMGVKIRKP
jgi:hypothetical protein